MFEDQLDIEDFSSRRSLKEKIYHFPALLKDHLQMIPFGSIKLWWIVIVLWIVYLILSSGSIYAAWYAYKIHTQMNTVQDIRKSIELYDSRLESEKIYLKCLQMQASRITEGKEVSFYFCKM